MVAAEDSAGKGQPEEEKKEEEEVVVMVVEEEQAAARKPGLEKGEEGRHGTAF